MKQHLPTFATTDLAGSGLTPFPPGAALHTGKEGCMPASGAALSHLVDAMVVWGGGMGLVPNRASVYSFLHPLSSGWRRQDVLGDGQGPICP